MTRRRYFLTLCAGWIGLALLRLAANIATGALMDMTWLRLVVLIASVAIIWVPASAAVLWVDRLPVTSRVRLVATHIAIAASIGVIEPLWLVTVLGWLGIRLEYLGTMISRLDINALLYAVVVAADVSWLRLQALKRREVAAARLEQVLVDVQLHGLAIQLQPHFLFNALQFVAETAHDDLAAARRTLELLRGLVVQAFALESRLEVTVAEEISFLRAYGEIQKSRFGDRFSMTLNVDAAAMGGGIPPLLLQPLVENASRHGFARRGSGGHIEVMVRRVRGDVLSVVVADDGVGFTKPIKEGQGTTVTRRRLARLYGSDAHLSLARAADGRTESRIRFPFREPRTVPPDDLPSATALSVSAPPPVSNFDRRVARIPFGARVAAGWLGMLVLLISCTYASMRMEAYLPEALPGLHGLFLDEIVGAPFWVALTVIAVVAARRLTGRWAIPVHVALAIVVGAAHAGLGDSVARYMFGAVPKEVNFTHWALWDVLVYAAIVLLARIHDLGDWVRAKMREEVTLNQEVLKATSRLARLRETQSVLLASLNDVIASPTMETLDRAVVDFADFLRVDVMAGVTE